MPLPQALAARLAKRGIIKLPSQPKEPDPPVTNNLQEEIIAEDYDDTPQPGETPILSPPEKFDKYQGWFACPNKWNVYHECSSACQEQWGEVKELDKDYNRKRLKMLLKYPLPAHWQEILDAGLRRYYYWNTEKELVSWLPPGHPRCRVSMSAAQLRRQMAEERDQRLREEKEEETSPSELHHVSGEDDDEDETSEDNEEDGKMETDPSPPPPRSRKRKAVVPPPPAAISVSMRENPDSDAESGSESVEEGKPPNEKRHKDTRDRDTTERESERERERVVGRERRGKERGGRTRERRVAKRRPEESDALDPMDPAAYSECPRGTWSSGLPEKNEARTGVDPTASGPLFQMRPYPNPGAVLRANSAASVVGPKKPT